MYLLTIYYVSMSTVSIGIMSFFSTNIYLTHYRKAGIQSHNGEPEDD